MKYVFSFLGALISVCLAIVFGLDDEFGLLEAKFIVVVGFAAGFFVYSIFEHFSKSKFFHNTGKNRKSNGDKDFH